MSATATKREYRCAECGRRLKRDHFIYSSFTRSRYCWPGEGCWNTTTKRRRARRTTNGGGDA